MNIRARNRPFLRLTSSRPCRLDLSVLKRITAQPARESERERGDSFEMVGRPVANEDNFNRKPSIGRGQD